MATRFDAIMARRGEIMLNALGMDYSVFEQSPIAFDYERMMAETGYSYADIVRIQRETKVGDTPLHELRSHALFAVFAAACIAAGRKCWDAFY